MKVKIDGIVSVINSISGKYHPSQVFADWIEMYGESIMNNFVGSSDIEKKYLSVCSKYSHDDLENLCMISSDLAQLFEQGIDDYLGKIYMSIGSASNCRTGQFFTPFHICEMMANTRLSDYRGDPIYMKEPSCGSGANILAAAKCIQNHGYNYQDLLEVNAQDLDEKCVWMTYVQLSLIGVNAVCLQGDSLRGELNSQMLITPMRFMKGWMRSERRIC